ncbi:MAG: bile acid:sodium symporter [Candidatus Promineifilaceae bacterium]|nr:bile acid:sodium symporter [Candidatus Promineifilaceae bacterium]
MSEILAVLAQLSVLIFVIASMLSMGMSLTMAQIIEPLKNARLVITALVANFILVPLAAVLITLLFTLDPAVEIGLILLASAAGAPFLPKLAEAAKGSTAFAVGLMVLLMVVTIIYLPLVLPLLLGGAVAINPRDIARSLIILMLIPLAIGLFINARYHDIALKAQPTFGVASNIALLTLAVLGLVLNFSSMIDLVGTFGILAGIIFVLLSLIIGYFLGGSKGEIKSVMALGTAQRNISAALVVAAQNFDSDVITYLMVIAVIGLVILMPAAGEIGKRMQNNSE